MVAISVVWVQSDVMNFFHLTQVNFIVNMEQQFKAYIWESGN